MSDLKQKIEDRKFKETGRIVESQMGFNNDKKLKKCPFCGGRAFDSGTIEFSESHQAWWSDGSRVEKSHYVNCIVCGISNKGLFGHQTKEEAVKHWNKRA